MTPAPRRPAACVRPPRPKAAKGPRPIALVIDELHRAPGGLPGEAVRACARNN